MNVSGCGCLRRGREEGPETSTVHRYSQSMSQHSQGKQELCVWGGEGGMKGQKLGNGCFYGDVAKPCKTSSSLCEWRWGLQLGSHW